MLFLLLSGTCLMQALALPKQPNLASSGILRTQGKQDWLAPVPAPHENDGLVLPMDDLFPSLRDEEVRKQKDGYLYGASLLGNSSYFPTGPLGDAMVQEHQDLWFQDSMALVEAVTQEMASATAAVQQAGGLHTPSDYEVLYEGQWQSSVPFGIAPGAFSNKTSDLLFSMERLSVCPYAVRRLHPTADSLPFQVDEETVTRLTGKPLEYLQKAGRLFFADHSYQSRYPVTTGRYTAACTAYFYVDATSGDFMPLAIKTNAGADLVYTPMDSEADWSLAKAMFNQNDLFFGQIYHLANSHAVAEIVHQAALRTLSFRHPVLALLNRLMYQAYAIRPVGEKVLFNDGGFYDQSFAINNKGVRQFATEFFPEVAGPFRSNYFENDLLRRGLVNCTYGPPLKSIPFVEDAGRMHGSIRRFIAAFVDTYYTSENLLALDHELQDWIREANGEARVIDFPPAPLTQNVALIDILTHMAFLAGVSHHVLNAGEPIATSGVLPLHPSALYAPLPTAKGVADIMPWLPPAGKAIEHIALLARFNRPQLARQHGTLRDMFASQDLLARARPEVLTAVRRFMAEMTDLSEEIRARHFDEQGLSQGMPFVWQSLNPAQIPFFLSV